MQINYIYSCLVQGNHPIQQASLRPLGIQVFADLAGPDLPLQELLEAAPEPPIRQAIGQGVVWPGRLDEDGCCSLEISHQRM